MMAYMYANNRTILKMIKINKKIKDYLLFFWKVEMGFFK